MPPERLLPPTPVDPSIDVERLRALNAVLERKEQEQAGQVRAAHVELDTLSYSVAHDLRAPLRAFAGFARSLLEDHATRLDDEGRRLLNVVREETARMNLLIGGMLAFSNASRQPLDPSEIDMTDLVRDSFLQLTEATRGPAPTFVVVPLPAAWGDRGLVRRVLSDLLDNAIKFSRRQTAPTITVSGRPEEGWNTYCIADNGVGFDPRYSNKLFGVFQRLHSEEDFPGVGVGLALARRVVQRHGGRTWAESRLNGGAEFYFTLPAREGGLS
jgi:signal transduction histidine kinase